MKNLYDWSLSSCVSNWNDLETHSTRSHPVHSLQTSVRTINPSARQKQHMLSSRGTGCCSVWSTCTPQEQSTLQPQHLMLCSPADSSSTLGLWWLVQLPVWCQTQRTGCQTTQHFLICLLPSSQQPQEPCQTDSMLDNITYLGLFGLCLFTVETLSTKPLTAAGGLFYSLK